MKAAIYVRKSKFTEEGESIENQINMCMNYANTVLAINDYEIYQDEGFSGGNTDRPQFKKLIKDIKANKFTYLICYRLDRISRNVADFSSTLEILNKHNVAFISIKEQFDTSSAMGRAMMNISATFAQLERETIAERVRDNLKELAKTGRWLGGPAPLGYKSIEVENTDGQGKNRKKHILSINDDEIEKVKLIYELFLKHKSFQRVSNILNKKGILSRTGYIFSREIIKQVIINPVYVIADERIFDYFKSKNAETYGKDRIDGSSAIVAYNRRDNKGSLLQMNNWLISVADHPGVITSTDWIKCQEIREDIKKATSNRNCTSAHALLSGLVVCAHCGSGMAPRKQFNKLADGSKILYRYYNCNLKNKASKMCNNTALNAYDAEEFVVNKIKSTTKNDILSLYLNLKEKSKIKVDNNKAIVELENQIKENNKSISSLTRKIANLDEDDKTHQILQKTFESEIIKLSNENEEINKKVCELKNESANISEIYKNLDEITAAYDNFKKFYDYTDDFEDKKRLIRSVVKFVVWDSTSGTLDIIPVGSDLERKDFAKFTFKSKVQKLHLPKCKKISIQIPTKNSRSRKESEYLQYIKS